MIELRGIRQRYPGAAEDALRGIDLAVRPGEVFGIIGRSGAGKSSLVRTINLLSRPSAGQVLLGGEDLTALPAARLRDARRRIGLVFQHFNLLSSRTVHGNVALPLELAGVAPREIAGRVDSLLELVGLAELRDRYPAQISGGQKQRVGIARALANRPQVLLSDEATSALDPETTRSILALLRQINREFGLTIVLITHQMQVIKQVADRVAVLDAGQLVEQGTVLEVFGHPQHAVSRSLLDDLVPQQLPDSVLARIRYLMACNVQPARLLRLAFTGEESDRPLLSELVRRFGIDLNIVHGQVDEIQGRPFGSLAVLVRGAAGSLAAAVQHLQSNGVRVQEVPHG
ncbi:MULTISPECIES: methionine ABC transporter ATP-binding protein [Ramlibacter]|uniref:Cell division ATP-binding protein FtsE n=1 Tax=Ramlibacter pinisoli TaxID=2682844 RepID=A0A6N8IR72_9BURK|nr:MULTISPECIES: methionine ABC transporter ATP-binding protein [Ramlibacter]MBA2964381.1 methionine ABC transporter ATP-binding protein [Ramlibacter sp. CGMCC 1.13660]MVQ29347.1 ATP-binding cassette domain-containing protein [Ramlibacter pinisoli]